MILEESENLNLERMATVRSGRGTEYIINIDRLIEAFADFLAEEAHEFKEGRVVRSQWYEDQLCILADRALGKE